MPVTWVELVAVSLESFVERFEVPGFLLTHRLAQRVQHLGKKSHDKFSVALLQPEAAAVEYLVVGPVVRVVATMLREITYGLPGNPSTG